MLIRKVSVFLHATFHARDRSPLLKNMRFNKNEKALNVLTGKTCIIVGTAKDPYKPKIDYLHRKEIKPDSGFDYLIMTKVSDDGNVEDYKGLMSAMDNQLEKI